MTEKEAIKMVKAKLECMTREVSGADQDCNAKRCDACDLCYAQGNMGEQKEWLKLAIEALDTCDLMSRGIPYIAHNGRIYKLTDEKGE